MKLPTLLSTLLILTSSLVGAWSCLSDEDAQGIVDKSIIFLQHRDLDEARRVAYDLFHPNITQYGDSINFLRGAPVSGTPLTEHDPPCTDHIQLGTPVYTNATSYIEGTLSAPGIPEVPLPCNYGL